MNTYKITNEAAIYQNSWENGEGQQVNAWNISATIQANNALDAIKEFFVKHLYFSFDKEDAFFCEENSTNCLQYSNLVDEDNNEILPNSAKYEDFKNGKNFYTANSFIRIFELSEVDLSNNFNN